MSLPKELLSSLQGVRGFNQEALEKVHTSGEQVTSIRINPFKLPVASKVLPFGATEGWECSSLGGAIPWTHYGYYLSNRPSFTFDPLFHAGCYYVQEASGMFLEQALKQTADLSKPIKVLDLCASPGGKSTHIQSLISKESLLLSNEVNRSRAHILKDNILKWGCRNVVVTNNDPRDFSRLKNYFDIIVADAPCSGSGLFRRDEDAMAEWSLNNVAFCSQRQQRILADVWPALKKNGILIYSTCSFSIEEDEEIMDWMATQLSAISCPLSVPAEWNIIPVQSSSGAWGYRFWPDKVKGEGFFLSCFRKREGEEIVPFKIKNKKQVVSKKEQMMIIEKWVKKEGQQFIKHDNTVYVWPDYLEADFNFILARLRVIYSGTIIGELRQDKLVPVHALAMSGLVKETIPRKELNYEQAIEYLKKKDWKMEPSNAGWQLITHKGQNLGWVNVLSNRVNNYYPKELRIFKES